VVPLGAVELGTGRHRALLFKYTADALAARHPELLGIQISCRLVRAGAVDDAWVETYDAEQQQWVALGRSQATQAAEAAAEGDEAPHGAPPLWHARAGSGCADADAPASTPAPPPAPPPVPAATQMAPMAAVEAALQRAGGSGMDAAATFDALLAAALPIVDAAAAAAAAASSSSPPPPPPSPPRPAQILQVGPASHRAAAASQFSHACANMRTVGALYRSAHLQRPEEVYHRAPPTLTVV
jgi:hypothetical protein